MFSKTVTQSILLRFFDFNYLVKFLDNFFDDFFFSSFCYVIKIKNEGETENNNNIKMEYARIIFGFAKKYFLIVWKLRTKNNSSYKISWNPTKDHFCRSLFQIITEQDSGLI